MQVRLSTCVPKHIYMYRKTLNICGIKISQFSKNDILVRLNFGIYDPSWFPIVKKIWYKFVRIFLNFPLNYTFWHLLESPSWGDSKVMPQCIVSWIGADNISNTHQVLLFSWAPDKLCKWKCIENQILVVLHFKALCLSAWPIKELNGTGIWHKIKLDRLTICVTLHLLFWKLSNSIM